MQSAMRKQTEDKDSQQWEDDLEIGPSQGPGYAA